MGCRGVDSERRKTQVALAIRHGVASAILKGTYELTMQVRQSLSPCS